MARIRVGNEELEFISKSDGIIELEQGQEIPAAIFADELGRVKFRDRDSIAVFMSTLAALGGNVKQIDAAAGPPSGALPPEVVVYIDLDTLRLYKRTESGWGDGLSLRGEAGQQGQQGERGRTILYGEANPNTRVDLDDALIGDMYAETGPDNNPEHQLWVKKQPAFSSDGNRLLQWERIGRPYGRIPADGAQGQRGRSIFEGTSNPNTPIGLDAIEIASAIDGDLYIETDRFVIWKKIGGAWHERGQSFKGPNGQNGLNGARGNSVYEGTLDPNSPEMQSELSSSQVGDVYINTATYVVWKKKRLTGVQWETSGTTFKGTDGTSGNTIFQGAGVPNDPNTPKPEGFENAKFGDVYLDTTTHKIWKYTSEDPEAHWTTVGEPYRGVSVIQGKGDPNYLALLESEPTNELFYPDKQYDWFKVRSANIGDAYFDVDGHDLWKKVLDIENYDETNPLLNKIWVKKGQSLTGPPAETLVLESTSYFIGYDKEGKNPSPQSFTLTANLRNYPESGITYKFGTLSKDESGNIIKTQIDEEIDANSIDINLMDPEIGGDDLSNFFGNPPAPITYYVDIYIGEEFKASDTITVLGVREGSNAINVILSNDSHVFPSDTEGNINPDVYFLGATDIYAYAGAEILDPKSSSDYATSNNCFKVKIKSLNGIKASNQPTNSLATSIEEGQFLSNIESAGGGNFKFICFPFDWTSETKSASIVYEIYIKTSFAAGEIILEKTQSFARLNDGNRGRSSLQGTGDPNEISRTTNPFTKTSWGVYSNSTFGVPIIEAERDYEEVLNANVGDKYIDLSTSLTYIKLESSWQRNQIGLLSNVEKKNQSAFSVYRSYMGKNWRTTGEYDSIGIWGDDDSTSTRNFTSFRKNCSSKFIDVSNSSGEDFYRISTVGVSPASIGEGNEASIELFGYSLFFTIGTIGILDTKFVSRMRAKIRRTPGIMTSISDYSWVGRVEFLTIDNILQEQLYDISRRTTHSLTVLDPTIGLQNEWIVVEWDLSLLPAWKNTTILGVKWCLFDKPNNSIDIEWITFGTPNFSPSITYNSIRQNDSVSGKGYVIPSYDIGMRLGHGPSSGIGAEIPTTFTPRLIRTRVLSPSFMREAPGYGRANYTGMDISGIEIDDSNNISGINNLTTNGQNIRLGAGVSEAHIQAGVNNGHCLTLFQNTNAKIIGNLILGSNVIQNSSGIDSIKLSETGNIKIKTDHDFANLNIKNSGGNTGIALIDGNTDDAWTLAAVSDETFRLARRLASNNTYDDILYISSNSKVGIGMDPTIFTARLNVRRLSNDSSNIKLFSDTTNDNWGLDFGTADTSQSGVIDSNCLIFKYNNSQKAYISPDVNEHNLNFTGQHKVIFKEIISIENSIGLIVVSTGTYNNTQKIESEKDNIAINEALPVVCLSSKRNQKSVFGVISDLENESDSNRKYAIGNFVSIQQKKSNDDNRLTVNAIGEGAIWITNVNGNLENGDYITSSEIPGYGMKQDLESLMNYTVAKITCDCDFDLNSEIYHCEEFEWEGKTYRKAFVGCTYHCG